MLLPEVDRNLPISTVRVRSGVSYGISERSKDRVLRQLVEALLFEKLVQFRLRSLSVEERRVQACDEVFDSVVEFTLGEASYCCLARESAFSRVRIAEGSLCELVESGPREPQLQSLVLALGFPSGGVKQLLDELEQTVAILDWNRERLPCFEIPRRNGTYQELESAIVEGHRYHPCFKSRTGFSPRDHESYGSEQGNRFQLHWLAVSRARLQVAVKGDEALFWREELGSVEWAKLMRRLDESGGTPDCYALVPIHPWQEDTLAARGLGEALAARMILQLGPAGDLYQATQSLRTLMNVTRPERANVKVPLDVVCTSSRRNLQEHFVCTAPLLSDWLVSIVEKDVFLGRGARLILLKEYAAMLVEPREESQEEPLSGLIGAIYRQSVDSKLTPTEEAVPFTALSLVEADGRPFIEDWIERYGVSSWVNRLIEVVLIPLWHMLVHHGIAFEAHAQNLILVHRGGWPEKLILRDFHEDTEFVPSFLSELGDVPNFSDVDPYFESIPDDEGYRMASTEALRELFMDCVYVYNLADISFLLERFFDFPEHEFWSGVRSHLLVYEESGVTAKWRIDEVGAHNDEIVVESLLKKKLMSGATLEYFEHPIRNTLRGTHAER